MSQRKAMIRAWMRTVEGRLVLFTAALALLALIVYSVKTLREIDPRSQAEIADAEWRDKTRSAMLDDLRAGMTHDAFLRKYGKAPRVERRADGLLRLHYVPVTVTFGRSGKAIETIAQLGR